MKGRDRRRLFAAAFRVAAGFLGALLFWFAFREPYERLLADVGERLLRWTERPPVTRLSAENGEILVDRSDFPPAAPRPGLPAADLHFNLVLLTALFALDRKPWQAGRVAAFLAACALLFAVQTTALVFEVRSLYATRLGPWSADRYDPIARNFWSGGFHFYEIAGRFAAPFAIWWPFRREVEDREASGGRRRRSAGTGRAG